MTITDYAPSILIPCLVILAIILIPLFAMGTIVLYRRFKEKGTGPRYMALVSVIVGLMISSLFISSIVVDTYLMEYDTRIGYEVEVSSGNSYPMTSPSGVVYVPISRNEGMMEAISFVEGDGRYSVVRTDQGKALRIEFEDNFTIRGYHTYLFDEGEWRMTMLNGTDHVWLGYEPETSGTDRPRLSWKLGVHEHNHMEYYYLNGSRLREGWDDYEISSIDRPD